MNKENTSIEIYRSDSNNETSVLNSQQVLEAGFFWKAKVVAEDYKNKYSVDEVLLLEKIDWVDGYPHTVYVLCHPSRQVNSSNEKFKMLVKTFLECFEFEPDGEQIREVELKNAQGVVFELQNDLNDIQSNPVKFQYEIDKKINRPAITYTEDISKMETLSDGMSLIGIGGRSIEEIKGFVNQKLDLAQAASQVINERVNLISKAVSAMTPFFHEKAAVSLARVGDIQKSVSKIMKGIESLDLYCGKDVHVVTIVEDGEEAPENVPLVLFQRKLFMDEEFCVHSDVDENFDFSNIETFNKAIKNNSSLRDQIMPVERCVVLFQVRRRGIAYSDNPFYNEMLNLKNISSFLLVRNGDKVHAVYSPIDTHNRADTLFPVSGETDNVFKGFDGRDITFEDIDYTDRLGAHDGMARHYKRFLILLAGLDHRLNLFGNFYPGQKGFDFISLDFQSKYFVFCNDAENNNAIKNQGSLKHVDDFLNEMNSKIQAGTRLACRWNDFIDKENSPFLHRVYSARIKEEFSITEVYKNNGVASVDCPIKGTDHHEFSKVDISEVRRGILCLDQIDLNVLKRYVYEREHRVSHVNYIRLFKRAIQAIESDLIKEHTTRTTMLNALSEAGYQIEKPHEVIGKVVSNWRSMNKGMTLPVIDKFDVVEHKLLMDLLFFEASINNGVSERIIQAIEKDGHHVIRLCLNNKNKWIAYIEPSDDDIKSFLAHPWVKRIKIENKKSKVSYSLDKFTLLRDSISEKVMFRSISDADWLNKKDPNITRDGYLKVIENIHVVKETLNSLLNGTVEEFTDVTNQYVGFLRRINEGQRYYQEGKIHMPVGIALTKRDKICVYYINTAPEELFTYVASKHSDEVKTEFLSKISTYVSNRHYGTFAKITHEKPFIQFGKSNFYLAGLDMLAVKQAKTQMLENGILFTQAFTSMHDVERFNEFELSVAQNIQNAFAKIKKTNRSYRDDIVNEYFTDLTNIDSIFDIESGDFSKAVKLNYFYYNERNGESRSVIEILDINNIEHMIDYEAFSKLLKELEIDMNGYGTGRGGEVPSYGSYFLNMESALKQIKKLETKFNLLMTEEGRYYCFINKTETE